MFSIGFFEIILIFVIAVILLKPEDWPNLLHQGGRLFKRIRIFSHHLQRSFDAALEASEIQNFDKKDRHLSPKSLPSKDSSDDTL
ncbi:MAG: hypothetical protein B7Y25_06700 [Alphaproteobacteria bacterium 16-39-46]|nr:MAG: hypothetical protein B7Y25_06700 [Alphaproteobacteria bacterium 16-39-46]OZA42222.1 MAG: hypothetical protein B7X84_06775 [Alphaproteobacteria bacterium 17-39-52]HQS84573.1 hypothetical protein [Alphaproteobacteria bacterium]HQS94362.1 hypothetical protein [Alphaproteobacteria bacterium]